MSVYLTRLDLTRKRLYCLPWMIWMTIAFAGLLLRVQQRIVSSSDHPLSAEVVPPRPAPSKTKQVPNLVVSAE